LAAFRGKIVNLDVTSPENECQQSINRASTEHEQSVNEFGWGILHIPRAVLWHLPIIKVLAACIGNIVIVDVAAPEDERQQSINRASTEHQQS